MRVFPITIPGTVPLATNEFGQFRMNAWIDGIVKATRAVKADQESLKLQNEFFEKTAHPLDTRPLIGAILRSQARNLGNVGRSPHACYAPVYVGKSAVCEEWKLRLRPALHVFGEPVASSLDR